VLITLYDHILSHNTTLKTDIITGFDKIMHLFCSRFVPRLGVTGIDRQSDLRLIDPPPPIFGGKGVDMWRGVAGLINSLEGIIIRK
jgi:hypothetical protein